MDSASTVAFEAEAFETEPLNATPLTAEDTGDFLPSIKPVKYCRGKQVGKRELAEKLYSAEIGWTYEPNARPHRFHETSLKPGRAQGCRCCHTERTRHKKGSGRDFAGIVQSE
ncbi:hypothetical protein O1611_g6585 [Lasiodiplodia mahajangana]|uniref:Uncharacterized protein n=1 Tax=Lasiodiplodia mahajangana TaxID=1108764 RepID=A0ACC2JHY6_9PEZI|nr:hypothetical protein O1611_g6585 [Lasiodiplodia mahajangana]